MAGDGCEDNKLGCCEEWSHLLYLFIMLSQWTPATWVTEEYVSLRRGMLHYVKHDSPLCLVREQSRWTNTDRWTNVGCHNTQALFLELCFLKAIVGIIIEKHMVGGWVGFISALIYQLVTTYWSKAMVDWKPKKKQSCKVVLILAAIFF